MTLLYGFRRHAKVLNTLDADREVQQWTVQAPGGLHGLKYDGSAKAPTVRSDEVLVEMHAASLNNRDLQLLKGTSSDLPINPGVVPGSDGAGTVIEVGKTVDQFKVGAQVTTYMLPHTPDSELPSPMDVSRGLGAQVDGTLREVGVFHSSSVVHMPKSLSYEQAATLGTEPLTAWNAVFGADGREVKEDEWLLVQGAEGVSVAALQASF